LISWCICRIFGAPKFFAWKFFRQIPANGQMGENKVKNKMNIVYQWQIIFRVTPILGLFHRRMGLCYKISPRTAESIFGQPVLLRR
jgi:hypothetical protein